MNQFDFTKALADETRFRLILLIHDQNELCVCELLSALAVNQPKISRHLALLRESGIVATRRAGQWIFYRLHPDLPKWAVDIINSYHRSEPAQLQNDLQRLQRLAPSC